MIRPRVLLLEDDHGVRTALSNRLQASGYDCVPVADGTEGLRLSLQESFDVVVLDLMLPGVGGLEICRRIRQDGLNRDTAILMLSARRTESEKVLGLETGADDYVTKPFGVTEFIARVGALTRRSERIRFIYTDPPRRPITHRGVVLDPAKRFASVRGEVVKLTPLEFELLYQLASQPGTVRTRQALLTAVWRGEAYVTERSVDALVKLLRRKIEQDPGAPRLVLTEWGAGYRFGDE